MAEEENKHVVNVMDYTDPKVLGADLSYSTADLSTAMQKQSPLFAHYGVLAAKASAQVDALKLVLETTEANVYKVLRSSLLATGDKPTEAQLEKLVSAHEKVIAIKKAIIKAKQIESNAKTAVEAFRHRKDMLIQHGLISREEMRGDIRIAEKNQRDDIVAQYHNRRQAEAS